MKLLHLADLHLGKRVNGFDLLEDQRYILDQVLLICSEYEVNAVLLAGDIYDAAVPPAAAATLLDWFVTTLAQRKIAVLAISGNHDSAERLDYAAGLLARQKVYFAGRFTGGMRTVTLSDQFGPVEFCLLPFVRTATVRHYLPKAEITDYDTAVAAALGTLRPAPKRRRILLAHQMVTAGGNAPRPAGSEVLPVTVGTVESVDASRFDGFSYVALGHIHRAQSVGRDEVRYAGAPLCYHLDECGAEKSAVLVTLNQNGVKDLRLLTLTPRRAMRHLTGPLEQLTSRRHITGREDYIWATLTDPTPLPDAMAVLRAAYPNAMRLDYARPGDGLAGTDWNPDELRRKPFAELFAEFFEKQNGRPLNEAELGALNELQQQKEADA